MTMKDIAAYNAAQVAKLLDYQGCIDAVRAEMSFLSSSGREQPLRTITPIGEGGLFGLMPGIASPACGFGAKLVSVFPDPDTGRGFHRGVVALFDTVSGELECVADAHEVTKVRTACASAVATEALARPEASTLGILGCGTQAESHVRAIPLVRAVARILVWGRSPEKAEAFAARASEMTGIPVLAVADAHDVAAQADIICTVSAAPEPVLLLDWVRPGTHINAVGSSYPGPVEIDTALVAASRYFADYRASALAAAAEFLKAKEDGLVDDAHILGEIGEVISGKVAGRTDNRQITVYKSLGHIVQDLAAARYVHDRASGG